MYESPCHSDITGQYNTRTTMSLFGDGAGLFIRTYFLYAPADTTCKQPPVGSYQFKGGYSFRGLSDCAGRCSVCCLFSYSCVHTGIYISTHDRMACAATSWSPEPRSPPSLLMPLFSMYVACIRLKFTFAEHLSVRRAMDSRHESHNHIVPARHLQSHRRAVHPRPLRRHRQ